EHELGDQVVSRFVIANTGGSDLVIDQIQSNCSCTGLEREENGQFVRLDSLRLQAGERIDLAVRVSVRGVPNGMRMINTIAFRTNAPTCPRGRIDAVVSKVHGGVSSRPVEVIFGTVPVGAEVRHVVDVRDTAQPPRVIERVVSTLPEQV